MAGSMDVGFTGLFAKDSAVESLPFYRWGVELVWTPPNIFPKMHLTTGSLCLGHLISHMLRDTLKQIDDKIIKPLHPVSHGALLCLSCLLRWTV